MDATSVDRVLGDDAFAGLVAAIVSGHRTFAPVVRDASVVIDEVRGVGDLARGVTLEQSPGSCRLHPLAEGDSRRFAWAVGPTSAKSALHPSTRRLFAAEVTDEGFTVLPDDPTGNGVDDRPLALFGLRPCDLAAMGVLDRVLHAGDAGDGGTADGPRTPLVVAVNCTEPGGTCFCASMGTGPAIDADTHHGVDIALWERAGAHGPEYLVGHTSERGRALLDEVDSVPTDGDDDAWVHGAHEGAVQRMGTHLDTDGLPAKLLATLESASWDEVATRCLSCGNCTMVCPTCFCTTVDDVASLDGGHVERWQRWDTCFSLDHSYVHGGSVRATTADRYRQWLTHKLSTWWAQFGESGCVGCGRCTTWCPVGIDLVAEATRLAAEADSTPDAQPPATAVFLTAHAPGSLP